MFDKILLAYDGSDCAQRAAEYTKELALRFGSQVDVVYAFGPVSRGWDAMVPQGVIQSAASQGQAIVGDVLEAFEFAGIHAEGQVVEGPAANVIIHEMQYHNADLIVIGMNSWGLTSSFLLGSYTDKVVHTAMCPVLVVK